MKLELFNLSYFIAFALLAGVFRYDERKARKKVKDLVVGRADDGTLTEAYGEWQYAVARFRLAGWLLVCEVVGFLTWCVWTGIKTWGVA